MQSIPLAVHPWPITDDRLALLKQAKAELQLDYLIVPVEAAPGSPGRPLCFGRIPPWYGKYAPIQPQNVNNVESIKAAMKFALEALDGDPRFDEAAWLSAVMQCDVKEITNPFDLGSLEADRQVKEAWS